MGRLLHFLNKIPRYFERVSSVQVENNFSLPADAECAYVTFFPLQINNLCYVDNFKYKGSEVQNSEV